ncbi:MAG: hypothetical protein BRC30_01665 [Nanohaloarchaea archaeon SW_7_46_7]|nr:MAG: hypothetical protein BRC30_01665 [Nanohaloarchaea archaeon SW_7_46_7]
MTENKQQDLNRFTGGSEFPSEVRSVSEDVSRAIDRIERVSDDFNWSVDRDGKYGEIYDQILEDGGTELEANIVSGAVKLLDVLDERGIDLEGKDIFRTTDWDGVVNALEGEEHEGIYPGVMEAKRTYPAAGNEAGEAIITARGLDYIRHNARDILGWRDDLTLAAENGNVIEYDDTVFVRDMDGYKKEDISPLTTRPLSNFQQLLRRQAAENELKLIFGKSISPARLTVSVEEVDRTGLRGNGFYAQNFEDDPEDLRKEFEDVARSFGYPKPRIMDLDGDEEFMDNPWFDEANPIVMDGDRFIYPDNDNANEIISETLKKQMPYQELRYSTHGDRDDLLVLQHDHSSRDIGLDEALNCLERAAYLSEVTRGDNIEIEENEDGWIDAYIGLDSEMPVKELAAHKIADLNYTSDGDDNSVIFHMDDKKTGVMRGLNTIPFVKQGHGGDQYVQDQDISHVESNAFPDFYLTVTEALNRYEDLESMPDR